MTRNCKTQPEYFDNDPDCTVCGPASGGQMTMTETEEPIEVRRWRHRDVRVFAAMDTMPQIAERILGVVGTGRVMNKIATYVHKDGLDDLSALDHATGLKVGGHAGYPEGHHVWQREDQAGIGVYLTHQSGGLGTMEGFGVSVLRHESPTEKQVRDRYHAAMKHRKDGTGSVVFDQRIENLAYVEIHGFPGQPSREDRIEIMDWNEHGVLRHTIITFVEPDYCDSGRIEETNYLIVGHRKNEDGGHHIGETPEVFATYRARTEGSDDQALEAAKRDLSIVKAWEFVDFVWLAKEKVVRERRSVR